MYSLDVQIRIDADSTLKYMYPVALQVPLSQIDEEDCFAIGLAMDYNSQGV